MTPQYGGKVCWVWPPSVQKGRLLTTSSAHSLLQAPPHLPGQLPRPPNRSLWPSVSIRKAAAGAVLTQSDTVSLDSKSSGDSPLRWRKSRSSFNSPGAVVHAVMLCPGPLQKNLGPGYCKTPSAEESPHARSQSLPGAAHIQGWSDTGHQGQKAYPNTGALRKATLGSGPLVVGSALQLDLCLCPPPPHRSRSLRRSLINDQQTKLHV